MVAAGLDRLQLALQLDVALPALLGERPVRERLANRAAGLAIVVAVGEPAAARDLFDVAEGALEIGVPQLELADARRVEDDTARRDEDQLAPGRRVAAHLIVLAHLHCCEELFADERVDDRRLADARRAEPHRCTIRLEPPAKPRE